MENGFEEWHPSSRHDKDAAFSWITVFLWVWGEWGNQGEKARELLNTHWNIWNLFLFLFLLLQSTCLNNRRTLFESFTHISNQEMNISKALQTFLSHAAALYVQLPWDRSATHTCGCSLTLPSPPLDCIPPSSCLLGFHTNSRLHFHLLLCLSSASWHLSWLPTNSPTAST